MTCENKPATPLDTTWQVILQGVANKLEKRGFAASIVPTAADAASLIMTKLLPESGAKTVAFGGSTSIAGAGLIDAMKSCPDVSVIDTIDTSKGIPAMLEKRREALLSDLFLCSANALTRDGVVMVLDKIGNRSAAVQFGPRHVILLVGRNKLCASVDEGIERVKSIAAPANATRLSCKTPCVATGHCMDCQSPDRICCTWTVTNRCFPEKRIHVVLVNEDLGF